MGKEYVESEIRLKPDTVVGVLWLEQNTLGNHAGYRRLDAYQVSARTGMCVSILDSIVPFLPIFLYTVLKFASHYVKRNCSFCCLLIDLHLYKSFIFSFFHKIFTNTFGNKSSFKKDFLHTRSTITYRFIYFLI